MSCNSAHGDPEIRRLSEKPTMAESEEPDISGDNKINLNVPQPLGVNTQAVVLYEQENIPRSIKWLGPDLDLKVPPENWMRAGSPLEKYIQRVLYSKQKSSHMSSIIMAHSKLDLVDSIDVISDAKNIKSLLEIPFAGDQPLSLMVHRVGKTLLIDDFDIHKHLFRKQQQDWTWMRQFYLDLVMQQRVGEFPREQQSLQKLNERNMFSKFLYYSIMSETHEPSDVTVPKQPELTFQSQTGPQAIRSDKAADDELFDDEPYCSDDSELGEDSDFAQHVQWKFEDIKMMIGTDLPIFTDRSSCVSLRLRDANSPITVLTGLDYWLDNLMCNVPEIAMCYHLGGFVQRYERFPTTQIPNLKGSEFKPEYVKDIAQNILSFLKSNATKVGHTYWLYKEKNGDIVKLYDLTSLTSKDGNKQNPFSQPLSHLLFRVAIKLHKRRNRSKSGLIHALLTNSLALAPEERPQMSVTAHVILCELYLAEDTTNTATELYKLHSDSDGDSSDDDSVDESESETSSVDSDGEVGCRTLDVTALSRSSHPSDNKDSASKFPPISGGAISRSTTALKYITQGLVLLDQDVDSMDTKNTQTDSRMSHAQPHVAIPLPYEPLTKVTAAEDTQLTAAVQLSKSASQLVQRRLGLLAQSWHRQSKAVLLSKAMFALYKLADSSSIVMEYGAALKYVKLATLCYDGLSYLESPCIHERRELFCLLVRLCGDVQLKLASKSNLESYSAEYETYTVIEKQLLTSAKRELPIESYSDLYSLHKNPEKALLTSLRCYETCEKITEGMTSSADTVMSVIRRIGNCCNELSKFYMDKASQLYNQEDENAASQIDDLLKASGKHLEQGVAHFKDMDDRNNVALLTSNSARLLRIRAQVMVSGDRGEFTPQERVLYNKAAERYQQALTVLSKRENCPSIWNLITFELSGVYCTIASLLQDHTPLSMTSREEVERDVTDLMLKALKYCDSHESSEVMRQYRAATIHHRLASLFHNSYRNSTGLSDQKSRQLRSMTESHYSKAANLFSCLESFTELLRVLLERVALCEFDFYNSSSNHAKVRQLESALSQLLDSKMKQCMSAFTSSEHLSQTDEEEVTKLLNIFTGRLQFVSLNLVKLISQPSSHKRTTRQEETTRSQIDKYKSMYRQSLSIQEEKDCLKLSNEILQAIDAIHQFEVT